MSAANGLTNYDDEDVAAKNESATTSSSTERRPTADLLYNLEFFVDFVKLGDEVVAAPASLVVALSMFSEHDAQLFRPHALVADGGGDTLDVSAGKSLTFSLDKRQSGNCDDDIRDVLLGTTPQRRITLALLDTGAINAGAAAAAAAVVGVCDVSLRPCLDACSGGILPAHRDTTERGCCYHVLHFVDNVGARVALCAVRMRLSVIGADTEPERRMVRPGVEMAAVATPATSAVASHVDDANAVGGDANTQSVIDLPASSSSLSSTSSSSVSSLSSLSSAAWHDAPRPLLVRASNAADAAARDADHPPSLYYYSHARGNDVDDPDDAAGSASSQSSPSLSSSSALSGAEQPLTLRAAVLRFAARDVNGDAAARRRRSVSGKATASSTSPSSSSSSSSSSSARRKPRSRPAVAAAALRKSRSTRTANASVGGLVANVRSHPFLPSTAKKSTKGKSKKPNLKSKAPPKAPFEVRTMQW
jgi:hypothetical protein